jgi:hypothetical protein
MRTQARQRLEAGTAVSADDFLRYHCRIIDNTACGRVQIALENKFLAQNSKTTQAPSHEQSKVSGFSDDKT